MKITTVQGNYGKTLTVTGGVEITFNHLGECEVKKEFGEQLLEKYPGIFFDPSAAPVTPTKPKANDFQAKVISNLENEITTLKSQLKSKENLILEKEADKAAWAVLAEEIKAKMAPLEKELAAEKAAKEEITKYFELKISLLGMSVEKIKQGLAQSDYPKEQWESLSKAELVEYVLNKK